MTKNQIKESNTALLSVDFKYSFDTGADAMRYSARACVSLEAIQNGLIKEIGANRFSVLLAIVSFMDRNGTCYPSQRKLSELTGQSVNTVNKLINELLEIKVDGRHILKRKKAGEGFRKRSEYYITVGEMTATDGEIPETANKTVEEILADKAVLTSKDVADYFMELYENEFGVGYVINYGRDLGQIKNKLLKAYDKDTLLGIVKVAVQQYKARWANDKYPLPTIPMLSSWLANRAFGIYEKEQQQAVEARERIKAAQAQDDTDKALELL